MTPAPQFAFWHNGEMAREKLDQQEIHSALQQLSGWEIRNEKLHRDYKFPDFAHAIGFMTTAAVLIEKKNHHPEWFNVYNRVSVDLTTHDVGGITRNDTELAELLNRIAARLT
ncbi:MAG: 4a-hydroxytetrahydrobiopterin dehydratase [Acidobacteriaceae bacterium]|nr:4a-hydroxytetrahydrobiopterin dehydratase [Acidobacteriaceae bacterium]MBV9294584.1 4a-hydroxytetrahydrobiopterin dehydratase [Acidobacteriaceae bacterium]MBV9767900.1 4a-hydroxytetrahydrobiopterin dehydratase [Acidobacteriaceae bacterium]